MGNLGIGIIAEYNPLHKGHQLHIDRARKLLAADVPVVVVLSSSFTQRGEPAILDKWERTYTALAAGADLVYELPFVYACNAGSEFARGAVDILATSRMVSHISCGMEDPHVDIEATVQILLHEQASFKTTLRRELDAGHAYPKAMAAALENEVRDSSSLFSRPNNSLAASYLLRIRQKGYPLELLPIQREGMDFKAELPEQKELLSATAVRRLIDDQGIDSVHDSVPSYTVDALRRAASCGRLCKKAESSGKLWTLLRGILNCTAQPELYKVAGMDEGLENMFLQRYAAAASYDDFIARCVCSRYTRGRIQRQVIRLLTNVNRTSATALSAHCPPYIRVLGHNKRGRDLLRHYRKEYDVQLITKLSDAVGEPARMAAALEFRASRLRELLLPAGDMQYEQRQKPVMFE